MPWLLHHLDPFFPANPPFETEQFDSEALAWEAYRDSADVILDVGGRCILVTPTGEQAAKISKRAGA